MPLLITIGSASSPCIQSVLLANLAGSDILSKLLFTKDYISHTNPCSVSSRQYCRYFSLKMINTCQTYIGVDGVKHSDVISTNWTDNLIIHYPWFPALKASFPAKKRKFAKMNLFFLLFMVYIWVLVLHVALIINLPSRIFTGMADNLFSLGFYFKNIRVSVYNIVMASVFSMVTQLHIRTFSRTAERILSSLFWPNWTPQ